MDPLTPGQKKQIEAWASIRDSSLGEISILKTEKESLIKTNLELAQSNKDIQTRIDQSIGRLSELKQKEDDYANMVSREIVVLEKQKSLLVGEIPGLKQVIVGLISKKEELISTIGILTSVHGEVFNRTAALEGIVDYVKRVSSESITEIELVFKNLKESGEALIAVNNKNVVETNDAIQKIPKAILEYRRPVNLARTIISKRSPIENNRDSQK